MPEISIIVPVYQGAKTIDQCLTAIFNQSYQNFEVVVVDDGSTDKTLEIIKPYLNKIKLIKQSPNSGNANIVRNRGARFATGKYLLFCDDDIIMHPRLLEKMREILIKHPEKAYVYSSFYFGGKKFKLWPFSATKLRQMPYIHTCSLLRREYFSGFDEKVNKLQDWDLWLTMLANKRTGIWLPEFLFKVKAKKNGISSWLPKIFYRLPWKKFGVSIKALEKYQTAEKIIKNKHHL